ncbi:MAG TPA: DUF5818 domain-containing protein [Terracidiphilus sp.]|jgi:hypothetical protein|nr:DUF5818 domain-containing protein [Terracidiphilus sp.]
MKSYIKRWLFAGMALTLAALTTRRFAQQEIEGSLDRPDPGKPSLPPSQGSNGQTGPLPHSAANGHAGPLPHSSATTVTFSGKLVRNGSRLALREVAGAMYPLDGTPNAWSFEGSDVRITGKIDLSTRMLHVDAIEPAVL